MSVIFGEDFANHFARARRKQLEDFEIITEEPKFIHRENIIQRRINKDTRKKRNNELLSLNKKHQNEGRNHNHNTKAVVNDHSTDGFDVGGGAGVAIDIINKDTDVDVNAFIEEEEEDKEEDEEEEHTTADITITEGGVNNNNNKKKNNRKHSIEIIDTRPHTIFRFNPKHIQQQIIANNPKNRYKKNKGPKNNKNQSQHQSKMKEFEQKLKKGNIKNRDPFLSQHQIRDHFLIHRKLNKRNSDSVSRLATNNLQFLKEVIQMSGKHDTAVSKSNLKKNLLLNTRQFNYRLRYSMGANNKRHTRNYNELQKTLHNRESHFSNKRRLFWRRGLRPQEKLDEKVMVAAYGRKKVWNAGFSKQKMRTRGSSSGSRSFSSRTAGNSVR